MPDKACEPPKLVSVPADKLADFCNPFAEVFWRGCDNPITQDEVSLALEAGNLLGPDERADEWGGAVYTREEHAAKIAHFVKYGWNDPIFVDVGVEGAVPDWPIVDGNHRYAAALYRGDTHIEAWLIGDNEIAEELGLLHRAASVTP